MSGFAATANPLVYTVVLTPTPGFNGSASVTLGNNLYTDTAGNRWQRRQLAGRSASTRWRQRLAITSERQLRSRLGETATVTFTFSDAPTGNFALGSISASNGALSGLTATSQSAGVHRHLHTRRRHRQRPMPSSAWPVASTRTPPATTAPTVSSAPIALDTLAPDRQRPDGQPSRPTTASSMADLVTNSAVSQVDQLARWSAPDRRRRIRAGFAGQRRHLADRTDQLRSQRQWALTAANC